MEQSTQRNPIPSRGANQFCELRRKLEALPVDDDITVPAARSMTVQNRVSYTARKTGRRFVTRADKATATVRIWRVA